MAADLILDKVTELSQRMVIGLNDHILVYHAEKVAGHMPQNIVICYNIIGAFAVLQKKDIPETVDKINTQQSVILECTSKAG